MKIKPEYIEYKNDAPEIPKEMFKNAQCFDEIPKELQQALRNIKRGRPRKPEKDKKVSLHLRVDPEVAIKFRSLGKGWQTQLNATLVAAIKQGQI